MILSNPDLWDALLTAWNRPWQRRGPYDESTRLTTPDGRRWLAVAWYAASGPVSDDLPEPAYRVAPGTLSRSHGITIHTLRGT